MPRDSIGRSVLKPDAWDKVTGAVRYAGDHQPEGALHLAVARSNEPHAELRGIDTAQAKAAPGVVGVWTAADLPGELLVGPRLKDEPVLCLDKVRRVGDPLALVAAETLEQAQAAAELIKPDFAQLPGIFGPEESLEPGAPIINGEKNLVFERSLLKGEGAAALEDCPIVIERTYRTQMMEHAYLEPEAGLAWWEGEVLVVKLPTKHAHFEQAELGRVLALPPERLRIICATMGGYFGDKQCLSPGYYSALATFFTGRPARMTYSREESFQVSTKRHPMVITMTTGATADGRLVAVKAELLADTGCYASYGPSIMTRAVVHCAGPYDVPNVQVHGRLAYTNNPVCGAMRGFGVPQVAIAHECQMDLVAAACGISPAEIRRINFLTPGAHTAAGQKLVASVGMGKCLEESLEARRGLPPHPRESDPDWLTAWGMGATHYGIGLTGLPNPGVARIILGPDGSVSLRVGTGDGGQGASTTMAMIAAQELGLEPEQVEVLAGDTASCPNSGTSTASRLTYVVGRAVQEAGGKMREALVALAKQATGSDEVIWQDGCLNIGGESLELAQAAGRFLSQPLEVEGVFDPPTHALDPATGQGAPYATYAFAVHSVQVAVEKATGRVEVLRLVAAHDVGKVIHPVNLAAQIQGAAMMGLGYALSEEVLLERGRITNPHFLDYKLPHAWPAPEVVVRLVEEPEPTGPYGAKGVAEPALLPTAPAVHNAVAAALGEYTYRNPVSTETLWQILNRQRRQQGNGNT
ncbi:MAG: xanthine dehydrogenase family protein molybdopterin-binding subunit [Proteobacteria bacterium]|nr:xanthine dehydrogenase family protein molybdopterin-binding subunit [Pseudomonadota bacterium]MBU2516262.1 xanthine dehydrogenase family protein molybdopterin-binding subunit [Pseudomonadota bacterium]